MNQIPDTMIQCRAALSPITCPCWSSGDVCDGRNILCALFILLLIMEFHKIPISCL